MTATAKAKAVQSIQFVGLLLTGKLAETFSDAWSS